MMTLRQQRCERLVLGDGAPAVLVGALLGAGEGFHGACCQVRVAMPLSVPARYALAICRLSDGLANGIVLGVDDLLGLVLVGGLEAGAFAGDLVHAVEHSATDAAAG